MNHRGVALFVFTITCVFALGDVTQVRGQQGATGEPPAQDGADEQVLRFSLIRLKHATASDMAEVVRNLVNDPRRFGNGFGGVVQLEMVLADHRTNSLVVKATDKVFRQIVEIVKELDVPQLVPETQIFELRNSRATELHNALMQVAGDQLKIAVDATSNRLIAQGDAVKMESFRALLSRLDEPASQAESAPLQNKDIQVRLVWLVAGLEDSALAPPPPNLDKVVQELEKMGVAGLRTGAQLFVKTVPGTPFVVSGSAKLHERCSLEVTGTFGAKRPEPSYFNTVPSPGAKANAEPLTLQVSINAHSMQENLASLQTTITSPEGHSVVLGVSPAGELTSVFVVQLRR